MAELYEIVIFTASLKQYADLIINKIDPDRLIKRRFYRNVRLVFKGFYVKSRVRVMI